MGSYVCVGCFHNSDVDGSVYVFHSYNRVNGLHVSENKRLLDDILRRVGLSIETSVPFLIIILFRNGVMKVSTLRICTWIDVLNVLQG